MQEKLIKAAIDAQKLSYSPYSHFKVGAAILCKDGNIVQGANIENAAYGSAMCGERNAVFGAYCRGYHKNDLVALAITADCSPVVTPCGACRQVLSELCNPEMPVYLANNKGEVIITSIKELLPLAFNKESL